MSLSDYTKSPACSRFELCEQSTRDSLQAEEKVADQEWSTGQLREVLSRREGEGQEAGLAGREGEGQEAGLAGKGGEGQEAGLAGREGEELEARLAGREGEGQARSHGVFGSSCLQCWRGRSRWGRSSVQ